MGKKPAFSIDKPLAVIIGLLIIGGAFIFASASFGELARGQSNITSVVFNHLVLGVGLGLVLLTAALFTDYRLWRRFAPHLFVAALVATALVFTPLGMEHGGGKRWIMLFGQTFQPSELLKLATIIVAAAFFAAHRDKIHLWRWGLGGLAGILVLPVVLLVAQPDLGTLSIICAPVCAIFLVAGARWRDIGILVGAVLVAGLLVFFTVDHARDRILTFWNPAADAQNTGWQINQSLIAVGSGGVFGRGLGQGIQKFRHLPEPMGDSIFAVAAEELGLVGALAIISTFLVFALRGLRVAAHATEPFGTYLAAGISVYLAGEAFINIAAMLGVAPLTGVPLTFISQGGSAMLVSLLSAGILLSVSRGGKGKRTAGA